MKKPAVPIEDFLSGKVHALGQPFVCTTESDPNVWCHEKGCPAVVVAPDGTVHHENKKCTCAHEE